MLKVITPAQAINIINSEFKAAKSIVEQVELDFAVGRILAEDIISDEYVPDFDRSTVDGYALHAADTFGCSEAVPAILNLHAEVQMGKAADFILPKGSCSPVPTGGAVPKGVDCVLMLEHAEDYKDGTIGATIPMAAGRNMIYRGDDVQPGKIILSRGRRLKSQDIGALAAIGKSVVPVCRKPKIGIISTGDELVKYCEKPGAGQIRDVNSVLLASRLRAFGAEPVSFGILKDDEELLEATVKKAINICDAVLISGGSSVGEKDATAKVISRLGEVIFHGIAMKPGKPTILGKIGEKAVFGLPGHPVAVYFVCELFVLQLVSNMLGKTKEQNTLTAIINENVSANHGRAQYVGVKLKEKDGKITAEVQRSKSGLISTLAETDGFFCIDRDCEGLFKGSEVIVTICE